MEIRYVDKSQLEPGQFGFCSADGNTVLLRDDLPGIAKEFLLAHEVYHSTDNEKVWWKREIKANIVGFVHSPLGFIIILFLSLTPTRLKYYYSRFKNKR